MLFLLNYRSTHFLSTIIWVSNFISIKSHNLLTNMKEKNTIKDVVKSESKKFKNIMFDITWKAMKNCKDQNVTFISFDFIKINFSFEIDEAI